MKPVVGRRSLVVGRGPLVNLLQRGLQLTAPAATAASSAAGALCRTATAWRLGTSATRVPKTTMYTPAHTQTTSGFRWARMMGRSVSGLRPAYTR